MGEGDGSNNSPNNKTEHRQPVSGPGGSANEAQPGIRQAESGDQHSHISINNQANDQVAEHLRQEGYSAAAVAAVRTQERSWLAKTVGDAVIPYLLLFQPGAALDKYREAAVNVEDRAYLKYWYIQDDELKERLIRNDVAIHKAIMNHSPNFTDCPLPPGPKRAEQAAYALGHGNDIEDHARECKIGRQKVKEYLEFVWDRQRQSLNPMPNPNNPAERPQWIKATQLLAEIGAYGRTDVRGFYHRQQIDRYNPDSRFRPPGELMLPPPDFNHHLPEKFVAEVFDKDGNLTTKEFKVRKDGEKYLRACLRGELDTGLDPQQLAVLSLHMGVLNQELPWWVLSKKDLVGAGNVIASAADINKVRNHILEVFESDFTELNNQLDGCKRNPDPKFALTPANWNKYLKRAIDEIPSTAMVMHFLPEAEADRLSPDQREKLAAQRSWDTRRQTDAELIAETLRLAQWRRLAALQLAVGDGLLFSQAQATKHWTPLPTTLVTQLRTLRSKTNANQFRNPSPTEDVARRLAFWQLIREAGGPLADPSMIGIKPEQLGIDINAWERSNLKTWHDFSYPWPLVYADKDNTNDQNKRVLEALGWHTQLECDKSNKARELYVDASTAKGTLEQLTAMRREVDKQARLAQNRPQDRRIPQMSQIQPGQPQPVSPQAAICECTRDLPGNGKADPFKLYVADDKDPMVQVSKKLVPNP